MVEELGSLVVRVKMVAHEVENSTTMTFERMTQLVESADTQIQQIGEAGLVIEHMADSSRQVAERAQTLYTIAREARQTAQNGKGFGAVAADIRRLAERAKDQASIIARIVRSVREDIGAATVSMQDTERETSAGAHLAQEAGSALESIYSVVERQGREIENINQMATQQLQSSNTVVQIMQGVSNSTQHSSMSTREAAQNMERLARLA